MPLLPPPAFTPRAALLAALALATLALAGCGGHAQSQGAPPPPQVGVVAVQPRPVQAWDEFPGRIEAIDRVELRPRVSGYIEQVRYKEGQDVHKGDVLFTIDARSYRAALASAQAQLAHARSQAAQARNEAARADALANGQAISKELAEQRRASDAEAQANMQAAQAALTQAQLDLDWTQVRSPIDGRAGRALVTPGNLVTANDAASVLTTVVSQDRVYVSFDADERAFLRYGALARQGTRASERDGTLPVQVALAGEEGYPHQGRVEFLDNQIDAGTGAIRVRAVLDNHERLFTPGLYARVRLPGTGTFDAVLVDDTAVLTDQDRRYVYVVGADGKAQRRDVQLGRAIDGQRVIEQGLARGDRVVVEGVQKIFMPGMPVQAVPAGAAAAPSPGQATAMN